MLHLRSQFAFRLCCRRTHFQKILLLISVPSLRITVNRESRHVIKFLPNIAYRLITYTGYFQLLAKPGQQIWVKFCRQ